MRAKSETVVFEGNTIEVRYQQPEGQVSITIALPSPAHGKLYEQLFEAAHAWVERLRFDLFVCKDQIHADGKTITLELDCPEKQDAVIRKLPFLFESIRTQAAVNLEDLQPCSG